jgi:hypothetical protein
LYPLPAKLGKLLKRKTITHDINVHPSLLDNVTTESIMKLLKFELWINYQIRSEKYLTANDIIRKELKMYQDNLGIKEDIVVKEIYMYSVLPLPSLLYFTTRGPQ